MPAENRDLDIVAHILRYCRQIETAHQDFGHSRDRFNESTTYQNAVSMCILQIGELVGHLSDSFKSVHNQIPWHKIRGMRIMLPMNMVLLIWILSGMRLRIV